MIRPSTRPGLFVVSLLLGLASCSEPPPRDDADPAPGPDAGLSDATLPWNPTFEPDFNRLEPRVGVEPVSRSQQDAVVVRQGALEFPATEAAVRDWQPGRIVVGAPGQSGGGNPFGFARRVISVKEENGKFVVETQALGLQDIVTGDIQVRLDNNSVPADLSNVDKAMVAKLLYGKSDIQNLQGLAGLKDNTQVSASGERLPGDPFFGEIFAAVTGKPPPPGLPDVQVPLPESFTKTVDQLAPYVDQSVIMTGQVLRDTDGVLTAAGEEFVRRGGELRNEMQTTIDATGREFVILSNSIEDQTNNALRQVRASVASVLPATFDQTANIGSVINVDGSVVLLSPDSEVKTKVNVGEIAVEFFLKGGINVGYNAELQPGIQFGASIPNPIVENAPPVKAFLKLDSRFDGKVKLKADFEAGFRGADQDDGLQELISSGQEALLEAQQDELEGNEDLEPKGTFTKVLFVSTPAVATFTAGPVPVVVTSTLQLNLVCGFEVKANIDAEIELRRIASLKFKAEYIQGGNGLQFTEPMRYTYEEQDTKKILGGGNIEVSCGLVPRINVFMYDSIGIYAGVRGTLIADAEFESKCAANSTTPTGELSASLKFQAGLQAGARVQAPGSSYAGANGADLGVETDPYEPWTEQWTIWEDEWSFEQGLGYCTPTCSNGQTSDAEAETDLDCGDQCGPCEVGQRCEVNTDCRGKATCAGGICRAEVCANGVRDVLESDVDCGASCDEQCANGQRCNGDFDCASGFCSVAFVCVEDGCSDGKLSPGECGRDCGGPCQNKCANNVLCANPRDCESGASNGWMCTDTCRDYRRNANESDVDCGGDSDCYRCARGQGCSVDSDCQGGLFCDAGTCAIIPDPNCFDRLQNQGETGVDCAGPCAARCAVGQGCGNGNDCASFVCTDEVCAEPSCSDFVRNGTETSTDCGGSCGPCAAGVACVVDGDCASGACRGLVCAQAFTIGGSLSGATGPVALLNNGGDRLDLAANGPFEFSRPVLADSAYDVTVAEAPAGQVCTVSNGSAGQTLSNVTTVAVVCVTETHALGGTVTGASGALVLRNGADELSLQGDGSFVFASPVANGAPYAVSVVTAPPGQQCRVVGGTGTMGRADVTSVLVECSDGACVPAPSGTANATEIVSGVSFFGGTGAGMAAADDGSVYFVENFVGAIRKLNASGQASRLVPPGTLTNGADIEVGPDGFLYVADGFGFQGPGSGTVWRIDPTDGTTSAFIEGLDNPSGLAFDGDTLLVASFASRSISRYDATGAFLETFGDTLSFAPSDIELGPDGNLYIAGFNTNFVGRTAIVRLSPLGVLTTFADVGLVEPTNTDPQSLAFDGAGDLWVSHYNGLKLVRYSPDGTPTVFPGGFVDVDAVNGIAISADGTIFGAVNGGYTTTSPAIVRYDGLASAFCP